MCGAGAPPAALLLRSQARFHPQPLVIFSPLDQPGFHWILPNIFVLFFQALVGTQDVIERFLLPNRARSMKKPVDVVSRRTLGALQDIDQRKRPAFPIAQRGKQPMDMIGHDHQGKQMNAGRDRLAAAAGRCGWDSLAGGAPAPHRRMPPSRSQCSRTRSRAGPGRMP
jgi:hypothetical protein